jgi:hypothetical protein
MTLIIRSLRRRLRSLRPRLPPVLTLAAFLTVLLITFGVLPAAAQGTVPGQFVVPLGYCQLNATALAAAVKLSSCVGGIPAGATMALLVAETAAVRFRDDGGTPRPASAA